MSRTTTRATLAGERLRPLVLPLLTRHAAKLEQIPAAKALGDPDAAARALHSAQRLYELDVVVAASPDLVALAAWAALAPGEPVAVTMAKYGRGEALPALADPESIAAATPAATALAVIRRLRSLLRDTAAVGLAVPTRDELARSVGHPEDIQWAEDACGAVLRTVGEAEPDVVLRIGEGERGGQISGLCQYFDIALVEVGPSGTEGVVAPSGEEFAASGEDQGWLYTTRTELPADADPKHVAATAQRLRASSIPGGVSQ